MITNLRMELFEALAGTLHHRLLCLLMIHSINDDEPCVQTVTARPATTRTRGLRSTTLRSPGCRSRSTSWPPATRRSPARCTTAAPAPPTPAASPPTCSHPHNLTTLTSTQTTQQSCLESAKMLHDSDEDNSHEDETKDDTLADSSTS